MRFVQGKAAVSCNDCNLVVKCALTPCRHAVGGDKRDEYSTTYRYAVRARVRRDVNWGSTGTYSEYEETAWTCVICGNW